MENPHRVSRQGSEHPAEHLVFRKCCPSTIECDTKRLFHPVNVAYHPSTGYFSLQFLLAYLSAGANRHARGLMKLQSLVLTRFMSE